MEKNDKKHTIEGLVSNPVSRRRFAQAAVASGLWAAGTTLWGGNDALSAQGITDVDILNFALNLEYLEAEFYTVAVTGQTIAQSGMDIAGVGSPGDTTGGARVNLTEPRVRAVAENVMVDEQAHVRLIRGALGSAAVAKPAINLNALGVGFGSQNEFLTLARAFEDVGVSAYGGAAPLIDKASVLATAAQIALTEAQHAGVFRLLVSDARVVVSQLDEKDVLPLPSPGGRIFQVDGLGLSTIRTPGEVLAIVYANRNAGANAGGFFPNGFNGAITRV